MILHPTNQLLTNFLQNEMSDRVIDIVRKKCSNLETDISMERQGHR